MNEKNISVITRRDFLRRAACAAVGTAAMTSAIRDLRLMNAAMALQTITDYKALVCIFLSGGNDSNNLIIPTIPAEYDNYATVRGKVLAIPLTGSPFNVLPINPINSDGHSYGFHPACPELAGLFASGKLATLFNTGTLVYPILNATQYKSSAFKKPPQLFSHADQVTQWQTSIPDQPALTGWGGRCADLLNAVQPNAPISLSVSLSGANTFEVGNIVSQYAVSTTGAIQLQNVASARQAALTNILGLPYSNLQTKAYANVAQHSIQTGSLLNNAISSAPNGAFTNLFPAKITSSTGGTAFTSNLSAQLKMVARLIEAGNRAAGSPNNGFGMKRQIFFCQVGGYDLHTGQTSYSDAVPSDVTKGPHANLLAELSQSIAAFQSAMNVLGLEQNVTTFTSSDFGRTFPSNGQGSDHGWGSHHLIVGGAVKGGNTYGKFPKLVVNDVDDTGSGRWIPSTSCDQYFATLATWFGLDSNDIANVFPNLGRFTPGNLGFMNP
jgi:uncharacterized protein (DUF1501 family)